MTKRQMHEGLWGHRNGKEKESLQLGQHSNQCGIQNMSLEVNNGVTA